MGKEKIAFIGTGVMGSSIVKHLVNANYEVTIFTRTKEKAESVIAHGAKWADTVGQAVKEADLIFTMVGYPTDVEEVYYTENGILANAKKGSVLIDMTTSSPELAKRIAADGELRGIDSIDAPVSGGDVGAQNGTLSIMCGGNEQTFKRLLPIFEVFGKQIVYQGDAGAGQHTKMCNQIAISTNMIGVCEALAYGKAAGLDAETILQSISSGAAGSWSLSNLAPRIIKEDFEPGFFVKHFLKDMNIALSEAELMGISLPGLQMARDMYDKLVEEGYGENGTQVLYKRYIEK
ncbi:NAD(P)-dependent oxidoreductase [Sporosarcina highlanderae]|uniref:NAD(P)-dependent oxidoreductase n=1 Tax=Sporosarcina highlanderae TaxID=3035916 RepID=A0ABT8JTU8_9BACL|nr:NAD(P)-dependent oxidoreductase [Sporosarcina highlanderae]MDN4607981.1 NAD(P)-dependent oxidoreductase [Sporosarcina highlanderae]